MELIAALKRNAVATYQAEFSFGLIRLSVILCAMPVPAQNFTEGHVGVPLQWSTRHVLLGSRQNLARDSDSGSVATPASSEAYGRDPLVRRMKKDWNTGVGNNGFVNANMFPAKWTFNINGSPSCTLDYIVFPSGANCSSSQASIVAFNELYSTQGSVGGLCAQDGPSVAWAYINAACPATTSSDPIKSSPVLSLDGTKVAWVTTTGKVQVLTIGTTGSNGTAITQGQTTPPVPVCIGSSTNNAALSSVTLSGAPAASNSAVYVDYTNDTGYVGDDSGKLHKLKPFFNGSPAEVVAGGWPVTVSSTTTKILTAPVLDSTSNNIFVADNEGTAGNLFYVRLAAGSLGTCNAGANGGSPPCVGNTVLAASAKQGISDAPLVDSTNEWIYTQSPNAEGVNAKIFQADPTLTIVSTAKVGHTTGTNLYAGDFDNTYYTSGPTNPNAQYYVCGFNSSGNSVVYQFGFNSSTGQLNSTPTASLAITSATNSPCSPLTEIYNPNATGGARDWLFLTVTNNGVGVCGSKPCVFQVDITNAPATLSINQTSVYSPNLGTSGLIVDNVSALPQNSNVYFVTLGARACTTGGNGACATKLQQSNLQ